MLKTFVAFNVFVEAVTQLFKSFTFIQQGCIQLIRNYVYVTNTSLF